MTTQVGDWTRENCSTLGQGELVLTGADTGFAQFSVTMTAGLVMYTVEEGADRESGYGTFNGTDRIQRTTITSKLESGIYTKDPASGLVLLGSSVVSCYFIADAYVDNAAHVAAINNPHGVTKDQAGLGSVDNTSDATKNVLSATKWATPRNITLSGDATGVVSIDGSQDVILTVEVVDNSHAHDTSTITGLDAQLTALDADISFRDAAVTGLEFGGGLTQNGTTAVLIAAGAGEIIDSYTDPADMTTQDITWNEFSFDVLADGGMPAATGIGFTDIGVAPFSTGTPATTGIGKAFPGGMTSQDRRDYIRLGVVEYTDQVITDTATAPIVSNQTGQTLHDLIDYFDLAQRVKGLTLRPTAKAAPDLSVWRDAGSLFGLGANYAISKSDPNVHPIEADGDTLTNITFQRVIYNNGVTKTEPLKGLFDLDWENGGGGVVAAIAANYFSISYMFMTTTGHYYCAYGQQSYGTYADAVNGLTGDISLHKFFPESGSMIFLAQIILGQTATVFDSIAAAVFPANATTSSSSGGGSAGDAIDISYTDTHGIGSNCQTAITSLAQVKLTVDQNAAMDAANAPTGLNPVATIADLPLGDMSKSVYDTNDSGIVDNSELVNNLTVETAVPAGALFTDTVFDQTIVTNTVQTIEVPATALTIPAVGGPTPGTVELASAVYNTLDFSAGDVAYLQIRMPKGFNALSTGIAVQVEWSHVNAVTAWDVLFDVNAGSIPVNGSLTPTYGTAALLTSTGGTTDTLYQTDKDTIVIGGTLVKEDVVMFAVTLDAATTLAVPARLHGLTLTYTTDSNTDA